MTWLGFEIMELADIHVSIILICSYRGKRTKSSLNQTKLNVTFETTVLVVFVCLFFFLWPINILVHKNIDNSLKFDCSWLHIHTSVTLCSSILTLFFKKFSFFFFDVKYKLILLNGKNKPSSIRVSTQQKSLFRVASFNQTAKLHVFYTHFHRIKIH